MGSKLSSGGGGGGGGGVSSRSCFTLLVTAAGGGNDGGGGCGLFLISVVLPFTCTSAGISSGVVAAAGSGVGNVASSSNTHVM